MTGKFVGSYVAADSAGAVRAVSERVFTTAHPAFAVSEFKTKSGAIHNISQLLLPLSDDGREVNMTVSTRIARYKRDVRAASDWLKDAPLKIGTAIQSRITLKISKGFAPIGNRTVLRMKNCRQQVEQVRRRWPSHRACTRDGLQPADLPSILTMRSS